MRTRLSSWYIAAAVRDPGHGPPLSLKEGPRRTLQRSRRSSWRGRAAGAQESIYYETGRKLWGKVPPWASCHRNMTEPKIRNWQPLRQSLRSLLGGVKRGFLLPRALRLERNEFVIPNPKGGAACHAMYLGEPVSRSHLQELYGAEPSSSRLFPLLGLRAELTAARARFPVVIVEINQWLAWLLPPGALAVEPWINQRTDLAGERYRRRRRGIENGFGRVVRRCGFTYRLTQKESDVEEFYRLQYWPHAAARWGVQAAVRSIGQLKRAVRRGFLLQVWSGDRWTSGVIFQRVGRDTLYLVALGMDPSWLATWQRGTLEACLYFTLQWARENGVRTIEFGGSHPHVQDGVFHHKTLWAAEPYRDPWHHTTLAFYLDAERGIPAVLAKQLVWRDGRLVTIAEALSRQEMGEPVERVRHWPEPEVGR